MQANQAPTPSSNQAPSTLRHQRLTAELSYWRQRRDSSGCGIHAVVLIVLLLGFLFLGSPWNAMAIIAAGITLVLGLIASSSQGAATVKVNDIEKALRELEAPSQNPDTK